MGRINWTALSCVCVCFDAVAQGGPPMITDDPGTPGGGHWEVNFAATTRHSDSGTATELPLFDINYGVGERIQLKYELPWIWQDDDEGTRSGLGNSLVGVKVRFFDAGPTGWQISTYPQAELRNPGSHSAERGLSDAGTNVFLPFEFQRAFERLSLNFEIGREFRSGDEDAWAAGVVIGREWKRELEVAAELHAEASAPLDRTAVTLNLGARIGFAQSGVLLVSVGSDLHDALEERAILIAYLGWQLAR
jgi:hypothetical protein